LNKRPHDSRRKASTESVSLHKPRRSRSSVERIGAEKRLAELLDVRPRLTYDDIRAQLQSEGFVLSRSAIGRWSIEHHESRKQLRQAVFEAAALARGSDGRAILSLEEANTTLLQSQLLVHLQSKREVDKETLDIAYAVAALTSSASQRERVRIAREKAIRIAVSRIKTEIRRELAKHPEVARQVTAIADSVETALIEREAARA
jgi:Protein of unknown function (DUF3486)